MIKFFRNIRQSMIRKNRFTKYILYALGEIILVVVGILIALQINNWNESRKDDHKEQLILKQLKIEYQSNLVQLASKVKIRNSLIKDSKEVMQLFQTQETISEDSLAKKLSSLGLATTFDPIQNDLVSSGNINIIKNIELKRLLTNWPSDVIQLKETEQVYLNHYQYQIAPFFDRVGIGRYIYKAFWLEQENMGILLNTEINTVPIPEVSS
ncbi:MAG: DUF6090 family protein, partial [Flavobacteriaceae bacterium]|nr:DUF6090 family protein [Flavobacteriaceae bacterium]